MRARNKPSHASHFAVILFVLPAFQCARAKESDDQDRIVQRQMFSRAMGRTASYIIKLPADHIQPTGIVFLLHGADGDDKQFLEINSGLATRFNLALVQPSMEGNGGWFDSGRDPSRRYFSMLHEIVEDTGVFLAQEFRGWKITDRNSAITGFSMGGQGALRFAATYPLRFAVAGSVCGVVDIARHPGKWGMKEMLGENPEIYKQLSVLKALPEKFARIQNTRRLALVLSCGRDDFTRTENIEFAAKLRKIGVQFESDFEHEGRHSLKYFGKALPGHLEKIKKYLTK